MMLFALHHIRSARRPHSESGHAQFCYNNKIPISIQNYYPLDQVVLGHVPTSGEALLGCFVGQGEAKVKVMLAAVSASCRFKQPAPFHGCPLTCSLFLSFIPSHFSSSVSHPRFSFSATTPTTFPPTFILTRQSTT